MSIMTNITRSLLFAFFLTVTLGSAFAQQAPKQQPDEVIRVNTELVQTAVTVTDRKGKFVDGLRPEDFRLMVDGKPQTIRFVEHVVSGTLKEQQLVAGEPGTPGTGTAPASEYRGRTIVFFVDDLHLSLESINRTRETILHFIDKEMVTQDFVAIVSASGQVGFLQQFTTNKAVLKAAVARLNFRPYLVRGMGMGGAPMSEYIAHVIDSRSDPKLTDVFIEECMKQTSSPKKLRVALQAIRMSCETQVKSNARSILIQSGAIAQDTYNSLDSLLRSSARMPGRKLAFFFSDGFLLDIGPRGADLMQKLQQVTDTALRAGVVVYTIDAKGLVSTALDATNNRIVDINGRLESANMREIAATQDALHALAEDTGGRALRNQNVFDRWIDGILAETANYYLLAWRPETEEQKGKTFHKVSVEIAGRPELRARLPRGYFQGNRLELARTDTSETAPEAAELGVARSADAALRDALVDALGNDSLRTMLALSYLNTPANGMVVTSAMQIQSHILDYGADQKQAAAVDLAGVFLNDKGKVATSFKKRLNINAPSSSEGKDNASVIYNHRVPLAPGIYQVRVAARELKTGRVGSARDWIVVPDLQSHQLTASSLLIGGQVLESSKTDVPQVQFSVDRRFSRKSNLEFWLFIYNATLDTKIGGRPNLTVQVQVLRNGKSLVNPPADRVPIDGTSDLQRIPYAGDLALKSLNAGRYEIKVTVNDLVASKTTTLTSDFEVE